MKQYHRFLTGFTAGLIVGAGLTLTSSAGAAVTLTVDSWKSDLCKLEFTKNNINALPSPVATEKSSIVIPKTGNELVNEKISYGNATCSLVYLKGVNPGAVKLSHFTTKLSGNATVKINNTTYNAVMKNSSRAEQVNPFEVKYNNIATPSDIAALGALGYANSENGKINDTAQFPASEQGKTYSATYTSTGWNVSLSGKEEKTFTSLKKLTREQLDRAIAVLRAEIAQAKQDYKDTIAEINAAGLKGEARITAIKRAVKEMKEDIAGAKAKFTEVKKGNLVTETVLKPYTVNLQGYMYN